MNEGESEGEFLEMTTAPLQLGSKNGWMCTASFSAVGVTNAGAKVYGGGRLRAGEYWMDGALAIIEWAKGCERSVGFCLPRIHFSPVQAQVTAAVDSIEWGIARCIISMSDYEITIGGGQCC